MVRLPDPEEITRKWHKTWVAILVAFLLGITAFFSSLLGMLPGGPDAFWRRIGWVDEAVVVEKKGAPPPANTAAETLNHREPKSAARQGRSASKDPIERVQPTRRAPHPSSTAQSCKFIIVVPFEPATKGEIYSVSVESGGQEDHRTIQESEFKSGFIITLKNLPPPPYRMILYAYGKSAFKEKTLVPVAYGIGNVMFEASVQNYLLRRSYNAEGANLHVQPLNEAELNRLLDKYTLVLPRCSLVDDRVS